MRRPERRARGRIERPGASGDEITIVAVSKTFPRELVDAAYALGLRLFGENRVQEAPPSSRSRSRATCGFT